MPTRLLLYAISVAGVLAGVGMVVLGLPEATPAQSRLLELSSLPLSMSVAAGVVLLHRRADRPVGPRSRVALAAAGASVAFGLVLIAWAYLTGPRSLVHTGQGLVWLGLLAALLVMLRRQPRRRSTRFSLTDAKGSGDDWGQPSETPADRGPTPSI